MKKILLFLCALSVFALTKAQTRDQGDFAHGFSSVSGSAGNVSYSYGNPFYRQPSTASYSVSQGVMQAQLIRNDMVLAGAQNDSLAVSPTHVQDTSGFFLGYEGEEIVFNGKTIRVFPIGHYDSTAIDDAHYSWLASNNYDSIATLILDVRSFYEFFDTLYLDSADILRDYAREVLLIPDYAWHMLHGGPNMYALTTVETHADSIWHFFVNLCGGVVKDADGNEYTSLFIGDAPHRYCWTKRNMETTSYVTGGTVPNMIYNAPEHDNEAENLALYGRLYNWYAAVNLPEGSDDAPPATTNGGFVTGICPEGWHIPDENNAASLNTLDAFGLMADNLWLIPGYDSGAGFYALPAGYYSNSNERFENMLGSTYYWSSVRHNLTMSLVCSLALGCNVVANDVLDVNNGLSVRCVKNQVFDEDGNELND